MYYFLIRHNDFLCYTKHMMAIFPIERMIVALSAVLSRVSTRRKNVQLQNGELISTFRCLIFPPRQFQVTNEATGNFSALKFSTWWKLGLKCK